MGRSWGAIDTPYSLDQDHNYTARGENCAVRSPAFRRFFARIPAKAGTTNIGHFFPRAISSPPLRTSAMFAEGKTPINVTRMQRTV